jgi:cysteinyl-tRNA synthetase
MVNGVKMSTSLNNFTSLTDLLARTDPRAYRLLVLRSHYRSPIEVTPSTIADAERALERIDTFARRFSLPVLGGESFEIAAARTWEDESLELYERVVTAMNDDLNTPLAVAQLFDAVSATNAAADDGHEGTARRLAQSINSLFGAMGLSLHGRNDVVDEVSEALVVERDVARNTKNWAEADRLRDELVKRGWIVEDGASGTVIRR